MPVVAQSSAVVQRGVVVLRSALPTRFGPMSLYWTDEGICRLELPNDDGAEAGPWWDRWFGRARFRGDELPRSWKHELEAYFAGEQRPLDLPVRLEGTAYQREIWNLLRGIPYGQTVSYRELAARSSRSRGYRAAGAANGRNPVPIIVPCHRVIAADGSLGGYSGGLDIKRQLLQLERAHLS